MSGWDAYVTNVIGYAPNDCDRVAIITLDGAVCTTLGGAHGMNLQPQEISSIAATVKSGDNTPFQSAGLHAEGVKYQFLRCEDTVYQCKKKDHGAITMQKTKTMIVIAHTKEGGSSGNTTKGVSAVGDYLEQSGY